MKLETKSLLKAKYWIFQGLLSGFEKERRKDFGLRIQNDQKRCYSKKVTLNQSYPWRVGSQLRLIVINMHSLHSLHSLHPHSRATGARGNDVTTQPLNTKVLTRIKNWPHDLFWLKLRRDCATLQRFALLCQAASSWTACWRRRAPSLTGLILDPPGSTALTDR
jgi:hypothetical protein